MKIVIAMKSFKGNFINNIIKNACGVIKIDACRVKSSLEQASGRYPANIIHDGSDLIVNVFPERRTTWIAPSHKNNREGDFLGGLKHPEQQGYNDEGSMARIFKVI